MSERRPRNVVSRNAALAVRAAELLDDGLTDAQVAAKLNEEFERAGADKIKAKAVFSFRHADYERVRAEREARMDAAAEVRLILSSAKDAGWSLAEAGTDLLASILYTLIKQRKADLDEGKAIDGKELIGMGKTLAKFQEVTTAKLKAETDAVVKRAAAEIKGAVADKKLTGEDLVAEVDRIMGIKK
jgi:hypothetical protein